jgi:hypothetical protein
MSRSIGRELPAALGDLLAGRDLAAGIGATFQLLTVGPEGWVSVALLSVGEVVRVAPDRLRLALWPGTTATRNLGTGAQATLAVIHDGDAFYLRLRTRRGPDLSAGGMDNARFDAEIEEILHDRVTYARITSGVTFELPDPVAVLARWRATVDALLAAPDLAPDLDSPGDA